MEFRDFRPYTPGDDLRAVDWNIYRRLGRVFLRQFEELEDLALYMLPDLSRSMFFEAPPRVLGALRTTLALAAVALGEHDTVGVFPFAETLDLSQRPTAGKHRVLPLAEQMQAAAQRASAGEAGVRTDLAQSLDVLAQTRLREGLVVVVSDFFEPAGLEPVFDRLSRLRHRLLLVQLVRPIDRDPTQRPGFEGDLRLVDCETGAAEDVSVTPAALERYKVAYDAHSASLTAFAERRHAGFVRIDVDQPIVPQLAALFESGAFRP